jgi:hypothetical protein
MPAFTFEKILPPAARNAVASAGKKQSKKPRGRLVQMLDRFAEARGGVGMETERSGDSRGKSKASDKPSDKASE